MHLNNFRLYSMLSLCVLQDLDDDNTGPPANGGTPNVWDGSGHPPDKDELTDETLPPYEPTENDIEASHGNLAREESFMSQPMLV